MKTRRHGGPVNIDAHATVLLSEINGSNGACIAAPAKNSLAKKDSAACVDDLQKPFHRKNGSRASNTRNKKSDISHDSSFIMKDAANPKTGLKSPLLPSQRNSISRTSSADIQQVQCEHSFSRSSSVLLNEHEESFCVVHEAAPNVSRRTGTSTFLGTAGSKLKGYLNSYKKQQSHQEAHDKGGYVSDTKAPTCQSSLKIGSSHVTSDKNGISSRELYRRMSAPAFGGGRLDDKIKNEVVKRHAKFSSNQSCASGMDETAVSSYSVKTKYNTVLQDVAYNQTKEFAKKISKEKCVPHDSIVIQVSDLPWIDNRPGSNLQGRYSGPVDESMQPNGRGTVIIRGKETLQFQGVFEHGSLMSHLTCDEERPPPTISARVERRNSVSSLGSNNTGRAPKEPPGRTVDHPSTDYVQKKKVEKQKHTMKTPTAQQTFSSEISHHQKNVPPTLTCEKNDTKIAPSASSKSFERQNSDTRSTKSKQRYSLGDVARTPKHMIIHRSNTEAIHSASLLKQYEQAFLKRSNGLWTLAILADRSLQPTQRDSSHWYSEWEIDSATMDLEESMLFVINEHGATKTVGRKLWGKFVRRMNIHEIEHAVNENGTEKS
ncbi:hypothetical protein ACHAWX_005563 [Stephanocyclus meneghinianus]